MVKSPLRVQSRHVLRSTATPKGTRSGLPCEMLRTPTRRGAAAGKESKLKAEYRTMSRELTALEKTVREELENLRSNGAGGFGVNSASMFERGRFYDEYCARRLKRKLSVGGYTAPGKDEPKSMVGMAVDDEIVEPKSMVGMAVDDEIVEPAAKEERAATEDEPKAVARRTDQRVEPTEAKDEPKSVAYCTRRRVESAVKECDVDVDEPKSVAYCTRRRVESAVKKECDAALDEPKSVAYYTDERMESSTKDKKKKGSKNAWAMKAVECKTGVDRSEQPRYSLRSRNKPPLPVQMNVDNSTTVDLGGRRTRARRN